MIIPVLSMTLAFVIPPNADQCPPKVARIGKVIIYNNTITRDSVIRDAANLYPGQVLIKGDLRIAEKSLKKLGIFEDLSVEIENPEVKEEYKNILIRVKEMRTGRFRLMPGLNSKSELVLGVVWEDRNFDPFRWLTSIDDITEERAFRGGGMHVRLELLQIPITPSPTGITWSFRLRNDSMKMKSVKSRAKD